MESAARDDCGPVAKTLHWVTVLLVITAWSLGTFGEELSVESAQGSGLLAHIWIGLTILWSQSCEYRGVLQIRHQRLFSPSSAGGWSNGPIRHPG